MPAEECLEPVLKGDQSNFPQIALPDSSLHSPVKSSSTSTLPEVRLSSPSSTMSPEDAPSTSPLAGEEGPGALTQQCHRLGSSPSPTRVLASPSRSHCPSFNLTCMTCHTHFTSAEEYAKHDCVSSDSAVKSSEMNESSGDVERFDGKIVYNPDGSAYIIDSEMSDDDTVGLDFPRQEGSIEDSQKHPLPSSVAPSIPPIANAIYVTKNNRAFHSALSGQSVTSPQRENKVPDVPIVHSYRVFNVGDKDSDSCLKRSDNKSNSELKLPLEQTQVPVKPILMCFICKLSFGYVKSFIAHAMADHSIALIDEETNLLSTKNNAIIQNAGREALPRISFLEPVSPPESVSKGLLATHLPSSATSGSSPSQHIFNSQHPRENSNDVSYQTHDDNSNIKIKKEDDRDHKDHSDHYKEQGSISVKREFSDMFDVLRHQQQIHSSLHSHNFNRDDTFTQPQPIRTTEVNRKSPISSMGTNGRASLSPVTSISPNNFSPMQTSLTQLTGTIIGACPEHMSGRPQGVSCEKCDMILQQSRQIGGQMSFMHSRNSCKTLKCPKCNWHYKYQETLEIHMKEKHPDTESTCIYCLTNQAHPRLARGETYTCGYKPYRCEVCNYSTTTKGNLSIHMQSDKHLNNMQELQNGGMPNMDTSVMASSSLSSGQQQSPPGSVYTAPKTPTPSTTPAGGTSPASQQKPKPMWRCDVCNYETNVARNLRIHMTSEKHTHNMMVLRQNVKHMQQLSTMQGGGSGGGNGGQMDPLSLLQYAQQNPAAAAAIMAGMGMGHEKPPVPEAALADLAYNQALLIQMISGGQMPPGGPASMGLSGPISQGPPSDHIGPHFDIGLNPESLEPPPEPVPPNPKHVLSCCVCSSFHTDSLEQLSLHLQMDRSKLNENEVLLVVAGNYICKLCSYKTNLKANFQLHCKTDKHLQKLQHVNHILEGGPRNEWKLKYLANTNPMHVRCNLCEYYTNSIHKLQLHSSHQRHEVLAMLFRHLCSSELRIGEDRRVYKCILCGFSTKAKLQLLHHIRSVRHLQMEQLHQIQRHAEGKAGAQQDIGDIFRVEEDDESERNTSSPMQVDQKEDGPASEQTFSCSYCSFYSESEKTLQSHIESEHGQERTSQLSCPLCEKSCPDMTSLEKHAINVHSVNSDGLQRLMLLLRLSAASKENSSPATSPVKNQDESRNSDRDMSSKYSDFGRSSEERSPRPLPKEKEMEVHSRDEDHSSNMHAGKKRKNEKVGVRELVDEVICGTKNSSLSDRKQLSEHQLAYGENHNIDKTFVCWKKGCNMSYTSAQLLHSHFKDAHGTVSQPFIAVSEKHVYKYRCQQCSLAFKTIEKLQLHSQYHAIRDATKCTFCYRNFRSVSALQKHVQNDHSEVSDDEKQKFQCSIAGTPVGEDAGPVLDQSTMVLLKKESNKEEMACSSEEPNFPKGNVDDALNSYVMACGNYTDPLRKYKCHSCKVGYTRHSYLIAHEKTLLHKKDNKMTYTNEKYMDPTRPYKCDVCKESFTQKNILIVHYNSVSHLHKLRKTMQDADKNEPQRADRNTDTLESLATTINIQNNNTANDSNNFVCSVCNTSFDNQNLLYTHNSFCVQDISMNTDKSQMNISPSTSQSPEKVMTIQENISSSRMFPQSEKGCMSENERSKIATKNTEFEKCTLPLPPDVSKSFKYGDFMGISSSNLWLAAVSHLYPSMLPTPTHSLSPSDYLDTLSTSKFNFSLKNSRMHRRLLKKFGFDLVLHDIEFNRNNKDFNSNKFTCKECLLQFSSLLILKTHIEEIHGKVIKTDVLESFANEYKNNFSKHNNILKISTALPDSERSSREEEGEGRLRETSLEREKEMESGSRCGSAAPTPVPRSTPTPSSIHPTTTPPSSISASDIPTSSPAGSNMGVPQQMAEMAAALNALTAAQMQQMHFNPMMMAGLGLAGLPLHLNPLAAMNLQPPLMPMLPHHMLDPANLGNMGPVTSTSSPSSAASHSDQNAFMKQHQQQQTSHQPQQQQAAAAVAAAAAAAAQQKRARTRITDDQLKILRAHFDINNSPSEDQINEMAKQSGLPPKVIKHWFRNTLFKERQRCKDSPYNFSIPPSTTLNLEEYEKTGEAKVMLLNPDEAREMVELSKNKDGENSFQEYNRDISTASPPSKVPSLSEDIVSQVPDKSDFSVSKIPKSEPNCADSEESSIINTSLPSNSSHLVQHSVSPLTYHPTSPSPAPHLMNSHSSMGPQSVSSASSSPLSQIQTSLPSPFTSLSSPQASLALSSIISSQLESNQMLKLSQSQMNASNSGINHPGLSPTPPNLQGFPSTPPTPSGSSCGSGKRANRTRFTDYQIKVLQEFFENNAYPKDDDLEYLSKLLNLSPRVIVVWFQNARQKARKVYENQPPIDSTIDENSGRFTRTPGLNYQCKKCLLVFQRYYELIRHQKTHCFKEEDIKRSAQAQYAAAQAAALYADDNNSNHSSITDSSQHSKDIGDSVKASDVHQCDKCNLTFTRYEQWSEHQLVHLMNPALFLNKGNDLQSNSLQSQQQSYPSQQLPPSPLQSFNQVSLSDISQDMQSHYQSTHPPQTSPIMMPSSPLTLKRKADESEDERESFSEAQRDKRLRTTILPEQLDYLYQKYQLEANPSRKMLETIAQEVGLKKRVVQVWFQNTRARERKGQFRAHAQVINKKCPFCPAIFKVKSALESHLSTKHAEHFSKGEINIDALPDLEDSGVGNFSFSTSSCSPQVSQAISSSIFSPDIPGDSIAKYHEEAIKRYLNDVNLSSEGAKREGETPLDLSKPFDLVRPLAFDLPHLADGTSNDLDNWSDEDVYHIDVSEYEDGDNGNSYESSPTSPASSTASRNNGSKRFRTHMTGIQVKLMKTIFSDCKTPTMTECEILGRDIGLAKRVIQIWFQNARAKEKKAKIALQKVLGSEPESPKPSDCCKVCNVTYNHKYTVQDHIFTKEHIDNMRRYLEKVKEESDISRSLTPGGPMSSDDQKNASNIAHHLQMAQLMALSSQATTNSTTSLEEKKPGEENLSRLQFLQQMYQQMGLGGVQGSPHPLLQHAMMAGAGE